MAAFWKTPNLLQSEFKQILKEDENKKENIEDSINLSCISLLSKSIDHDQFADVYKDHLNAAILIAQRDVKERNEHFRLFNKQLHENDVCSESSIVSRSSKEVKSVKSKVQKSSKTSNIKSFSPLIKLLPDRGNSPPTHDNNTVKPSINPANLHTSSSPTDNDLSNHISHTSHLLTKIGTFVCHFNYRLIEEEVESDRRRSRLAGRSSRFKRSLYDLQRSLRSMQTFILRSSAGDYDLIQKKMLLLYRGLNGLLRLVVQQMIDLSDPASFLHTPLFKQLSSVLRQITSTSEQLHITTNTTTNLSEQLQHIMNTSVGNPNHSKFNKNPSRETILDQNNNIISDPNNKNNLNINYNHLDNNNNIDLNNNKTKHHDTQQRIFKTTGDGGLIKSTSLTRHMFLSNYIKKMAEEKFSRNEGGGGMADGDWSKWNNEDGGMNKIKDKILIRSNLNNRRIRFLNTHKRLKDSKSKLSNDISVRGEGKRAYSTPPTTTNNKKAFVVNAHNENSCVSLEAGAQSYLSRSRSKYGPINKTSINRIPLRSLSRRHNEGQNGGHLNRMSSCSFQHNSNKPMWFEPENIYLTKDDSDEEKNGDDGDGVMKVDVILERIKQMEAQRKEIQDKWLRVKDDDEEEEEGEGDDDDERRREEFRLGKINGGSSANGERLYAFWKKKDQDFFKDGDDNDESGGDKDDEGGDKDDGGGDDNDEEGGDDNDNKGVNDEGCSGLGVSKDELRKSEKSKLIHANSGCHVDEEEEDEDEWMARVYGGYLEKHWGKLREVLGTKVDPLTLCDTVTDGILDDVVNDICNEVNNVGQELVNNIYQSEFTNDNQSQSNPKDINQ